VPIIDIRAQIGTSRTWGAPSGPADLLKVMTKHNMAGCVVSSTLANSCDFQTGNRRIQQEVDKQPRFLGCAVANAAQTDASIADMHKYVGAKNFAGVILTSGVPGKHVRFDECSDILNAFRRFGKVIFLEAQNRDGVAAAKEIAERFPTIKFAMLSMGGADWLNGVAAAAKTVNLYLEASGDLNPNKIKHAYEAVGPNRLLFGSNWPYSDPALTIGLIEDADISDGDKKRIFELNAIKLFGYGKPAE